MYVWFLSPLTLIYVCMCDAYFLDLDTCDHDTSTYYAFIHDPWSWYRYVWCIQNAYVLIYMGYMIYMMHVWMMHISVILGLDPEAAIYVWSLTLMYVCMMHIVLILIYVTMMHIVWCIYTCMYDAFINFPWSLTLVHVCMMPISMLDLGSEACTYV